MSAPFNWQPLAPETPLPTLIAQLNRTLRNLSVGTVTLTAPLVVGTDPGGTELVRAASGRFTSLVGTLVTAAQPNIASVGTLTGLTVTAPIVGSVSGNAGTATALQIGRTINGVTFDGSINITVPAAAGTLTGATLAAGVTGSSLTSVGTLAGLTVSPGTLNVTGNSLLVADGFGLLDRLPERHQLRFGARYQSAAVTYFSLSQETAPTSVLMTAGTAPTASVGLARFESIC
jgi:hypothetical protein